MADQKRKYALQIPILILAVALASFTACNSRFDKVAADGGGFTAEQLTTFDALKTDLFDQRCSRCHSSANASGGVDLSSYVSILSTAGLVVRGSPDASLIYTEVDTGGMPVGDSRLTPREVQAIRDWILAGAPNGFFTPSLPPTPVPAPAPQPSATPIGRPAPTPRPTATPAPGTVVYLEIQQKIFDQSCTRCHSGSRPSKGIDLSNYTALMAKSGNVVAGSPTKSRVYTEIANGSMPPSGPKVSAQLMKELKDWITQGARK